MPLRVGLARPMTIYLSSSKGYYFPLSLVGMNPFGALIVFLIADALMVFGATSFSCNFLGKNL